MEELWGGECSPTEEVGGGGGWGAGMSGKEPDLEDIQACYWATCHRVVCTMVFFHQGQDYVPLEYNADLQSEMDTVGYAAEDMVASVVLVWPQVVPQKVEGMVEGMVALLVSVWLQAVPQDVEHVAENMLAMLAPVWLQAVSQNVRDSC